MTDGRNSTNSIPDNDLREDYYDNLHTAYRNMRSAFGSRSASGVTQDDIAVKLGVDKSLISRRLNGEENLTLRTLSYMATAMECRLVIIFQPFESIPRSNQFSVHFAGWPETSSSSNTIEADRQIQWPPQ
jgi:hypothetical protein